MSVIPRNDGTCPSCGKEVADDGIPSAATIVPRSSVDTCRNARLWAIGISCLVVSMVAAGVAWRWGVSEPASVPSNDESNGRTPSASDADGKNSLENHILTVQVHNEEKQPVANAKVWLFLTLDPRLQHKHRAFGTSAADGTISLSFPKVWLDTAQPPLSAYDIWVVQDGFAVTAQSISRPDLSNRSTKTVVLKKSGSPVVRILSPQDEPVAASVSLAEVSPSGLGVMSFLPEEVRRHATSRSGDVGRASLVGFPKDDRAGIRVESETYGTQIFNPEVMPDEIRLMPVGRIEGIVIGDHPEWIADIPVAVFTRSENSTAAIGESRVTSDKDGRFVIPAIAAGIVGFRMSVPPEWPVRPTWDENLRVVSGGIQTIRFRMERTVKLLGSVQTSGRPVPKLQVHILHGVDEELSEWATTNESGRFEASVLPGRVHFSAGFADGVVHYKIKEWSALDITVPATSPTFETPPLEVVPAQ